MTKQISKFNNQSPSKSFIVWLLGFRYWSLFGCCFLIFGIFLCGCATIYNPATQRNEHVIIDSATEVQIGRSMADNIIKKDTPPLNDSQKQFYVNKVGQRVVAVCDRRDIVYHFMVLDSPDYNAFALPGGYIYIYRGLLEKIDEDELAAILAHEIGHVTARHSVKKMESVLGYNLLMGLVVVGLGQKDEALMQQMNSVTNIVFDLLSKGFSREDEFLADSLAVKYTQKAGYDPYGMSRALELLKKQSGPGGRVFEILSDHPRMDERIRRVTEAIQTP